MSKSKNLEQTHFKEYDYCGWIPTVSGRLAFSEFGNINYPTKAKKWTYTFDKDRHVLCIQKRYLSDTTIPILSYAPEILDLIDRIISKKTGKMWMCAAASYDDNENALYGTVGIFAKKYWSRNQSKFYEIGNIIDANDRIPFAADKEILKIRDLNIQEGLISAKFKILRNGETYIKILQKEKNEVIKYSEDSEEVIVTQIYYFLKDCLHKHRHHSQSTDSILNIYALDNEKDQDLQQKQWKLDVLYTLYRKVINRRRNGSTVDLSDSLGVLAYAESFYKIFKKDLQGLEDKSS